MIEFFGDPWPSGICDEGRQVTTPINDDCELCGEGICDQDQGSFMFGLDGQKKPVHRECSLRSVMGGIGHWNNHVAWCIDRHDPDGGYRGMPLRGPVDPRWQEKVRLLEEELRPLTYPFWSSFKW